MNYSLFPHLFYLNNYQKVIEILHEKISEREARQNSQED